MGQVEIKGGALHTDSCFSSSWVPYSPSVRHHSMVDHSRPNSHIHPTAPPLLLPTITNTTALHIGQLLS